MEVLRISGGVCSRRGSLGMACSVRAVSLFPADWDRCVMGVADILLVETRRRGGSSQHQGARRSSVWCVQAR